MTTSVKVKALCGSEKQVNVIIHNKDTGELIEKHILDDQEAVEVYTYDERIISIREVSK